MPEEQPVGLVNLPENNPVHHHAGDYQEDSDPDRNAGKSGDYTQGKEKDIHGIKPVIHKLTQGPRASYTSGLHTVKTIEGMIEHDAQGSQAEQPWPVTIVDIPGNHQQAHRHP